MKQQVKKFFEVRRLSQQELDDELFDQELNTNSRFISHRLLEDKVIDTIVEQALVNTNIQAQPRHIEKLTEKARQLKIISYQYFHFIYDGVVIVCQFLYAAFLVNFTRADIEEFRENRIVHCALFLNFFVVLGMFAQWAKLDWPLLPTLFLGHQLLRGLIFVGSLKSPILENKIIKPAQEVIELKDPREPEESDGKTWITPERNREDYGDEYENAHSRYSKFYN